MFASFFPMAAAITRDDPTATVLGFSWLDDAATALSPFDAWQSEARTDLNGQRLAAALGQVLAPGFPAAAVASTSSGRATAPRWRPSRHRARPAARAAHPARLARERARRASPGRRTTSRATCRSCRSAARRGTRSWTATSRSPASGTAPFPALESVVDVQLDPAQLAGPSGDDLVARHGYPVDWYTASADDLAAGVGFAWSPLVGTPPACVACFFRQDWVRPDGRVDPTRRARSPSRARDRAAPDLERAARGAAVAGTGIRVASPTASCSPRPGSRLWQVQFDRAPDDLAIEFDDRFTAPGPGAQLAVWLDDRQVLAAAADWSGATGHHAVVDVSSLDAGQHTLTAVLTPPHGRGARAVILGGFAMRGRPVAAAASASLRTSAKLALLALLVLAVLGAAGVVAAAGRAPVSATRRRCPDPDLS